MSDNQQNFKKNDDYPSKHIPLMSKASMLHCYINSDEKEKKPQLDKEDKKKTNILKKLFGF